LVPACIGNVSGALDAATWRALTAKNWIDSRGSAPRCAGSAHREHGVQLIERVAAHEPVVLLVEAVEDRGVGEDLIQELAAHLPRLTGETDRKTPQPVERLNFVTMLVQQRLTGLRTVVPSAPENVNLVNVVRHVRRPPFVGRSVAGSVSTAALGFTSVI
jgi:hypothetical protein